MGDRNREYDQQRSGFYASKFWRRLARACIRRDGRCCICAGTNRLTAAHIRARPKGQGEPCELDRIDNLMTLCGPCHSRYEADVKARKVTPHRQLVDSIGGALLKARGVTSA